MGNLGKLKIVFEGVDKTKKVFAKLKSGLNSVKNAVGKTLKVFGGLTAGVLALGGSLALITKKSFDYLDVIGKLATQTGATTDLIQAFQLGALESGSSIEQANKAIQKFSKQVGEAQGGLATYKDIFKELDVEILNADGSTRKFDDVLLDTADGLQNLESSFRRNSILTQLFGRAGQNLSAILVNGSEEIQKFIDRNKSLGLAIEMDSIKKVEKFNDRVSRIGFSFRALRDSITTAFLPVLDDLANKFEEALATKNIQDFGKELVVTFTESLALTLLAIDQFRMGFQETFKPLFNTISGLKIAILGVERAFLLVKSSFGGEIDTTRLSEIKNEFLELRNSLDMPVEPSEGITNAVTQLTNLRDILLKTKEAASDLANPETLSEAEKRFREFIAQVQTPIKEFKDSFKTTGAMIGDTIVSSMKKFEDTLVDGLMSGKFEFKNFANFVIKELLRIAVQKLIIDRITGGFTSFLGNIGFAAKGGTVTGNKPYIVGERGAELFVPNKTGTIVANNQLSTASGGMGQNVHITYNIQSFDSKDTLQAITENAPTISAIIQGEFNKHGRRGFA